MKDEPNQDSTLGMHCSEENGKDEMKAGEMLTTSIDSEGNLSHVSTEPTFVPRSASRIAAEWEDIRKMEQVLGLSPDPRLSIVTETDVESSSENPFDSQW